MKKLLLVAILIVIASQLGVSKYLGLIIPLIGGYFILKIIGTMISSALGRSKNNWWL